MTEIRTAAVSAVATKLLARETPRQVAILGSGVQGRSHVEAMRAIAPDCEIRLWSRNPANAEALALEAHAHVAASVRGGARRRRRRLHLHLGEGADPRARLARARSAPERRRLLVARAREVDSATMAAASLFVDRRESTLNEAGDYLVPAAEGLIGPDHIRAELGEMLIGSHPGRTSADEITLFKSLGIAVEDLASAELCFARARERGIGVEVEF